MVPFVAVVTVRARNSFSRIMPLTRHVFIAASIWHSLFLDLYICDHRHVQTCPGMTRLYAPRGSNCGSPRVAKGRGSSLALLERDLPSSLLPLPTIALPSIVSSRICRAASDRAPWHTCYVAMGAQDLVVETARKRTHTTYHLCMVAERLV